MSKLYHKNKTFNIFPASSDLQEFNYRIKSDKTRESSVIEILVKGIDVEEDCTCTATNMRAPCQWIRKERLIDS